MNSHALDLRMKENNLTIPHAEIVNRKFTIVILKDLFLKSKIPGLNLTAEELLKIGESTRDTTIDSKEHASWTVLASMILNLDETLNRE